MRLSAFIACGLLAGTASAQAGTNVGVSIGINQPGVYGRIDIGNVAPPPVVYAQPVLIAPQPVVVHQRPVYLYVPPGHQRNWARHCHAYGACAQPVYFVKESWVREHHAHGHRGKGHGKHREGRGKGHGRHDD
jgi:hypothetical protein